MAYAKQVPGGLSDAPENGYALVPDSGPVGRLQGEALDENVVYLIAHAMSAKEASSHPAVTLLRGLPSTRQQFSELPPDDACAALVAGCLYYPDVVVRNMHLLRLSEHGIALLCHSLGTDRAQLGRRLERENPNAIVSVAGQLVAVRRGIRESIWNHLSTNDTGGLLDIADSVPEAKESRVADHRALVRQLPSIMEAYGKLVDPTLSNDMSLEGLSPSQRVGLSRMQAEVRTILMRNHRTQAGPFGDVYEAAWTAASGEQSLEERLRVQDLTLDEASIQATVDKHVAALGVPPALAGQYMRIYRNILAHARNARTIVSSVAWPAGSALFQLVTGLPPAGNVECIEMPYCVALRCHSLDDYTRLERGLADDMAVDEDMLKEAAGAAYALSSVTLKDGRSLNIVVECVPRSLSPEQSLRNIDHEQQHIYTSFFDAIPLHSFAGQPPRRDQYPTDAEWLRRSLDYLRDVFAEYLSKHEILSFSFMGASMEYASSVLRDAGGLYQYHNDVRRILDPRNTILTGRLGNIFFRQFERPMRAAQEEGIRAMSRLLSAGWSRAEACELLVTEPLVSWQRCVDAVLANAG